MSFMRIRPRRLVLVGSILVDILLYVERLPERGGDRLAQGTLMSSGGGFNVLSAAVRLGLTACYAGRVGDGPMGTRIAQDLSQAGIPLLLPRVEGEDSGFDVGLVEADGERTFVTAPGTESRLTPEDLRTIPLLDGDAVYISGYELCYPISGAALEAWLPTLPGGVLLVVDPGPLVAEIPQPRLAAVLARTDLFSLNQRELAALYDDPVLPASLAELLPRLAPAGLLVARTGGDGCWIASAGQQALHLPAYPARVRDSTGAGDAHVAAFLASLARGHSCADAARHANLAAALSTEQAGPATGPTLAVLQAALQERAKM